MKTTRVAVALFALGCQATRGVGTSQSAPAATSVVSARYASKPPPPAEFADPERQNKIAVVVPQLIGRIDSFFKTEKPPSVSVVFVCDGKAVLVRTLGVADRRTNTPATPTTLYRIGSITKTFTATLIVALRDLGRLRLDDPAELYLPELGQVTYPFPDSSRITLRHLLTHTSGLPRLGDFDYTRPHDAVTEAELLSAISRARLDTAPGTAFVYSNFGMSLVGLIAARRAPEGALRAALTARVLAPLAMTRTTFDPSTLPGADVATGYAETAKPEPASPWQLGASEAAGGLWSSADDMGRWIAYQLQAWPPQSAPESGPLLRASLRELHTPTFSFGLDAHRGAERAEASTTALGFAWHIKQTCEFERLVEHDGAIDGFRASLAFAPDRGFGFVVLANSLDAHTNQLLDRLLAVAAPVLEPRRPQPAPEVPDILRELAASPGACSQGSYQALFAKDFREHVSFAQYAPLCAQFAANHGACRYGGARRVENPHSGDFTLTCDRGSVLVSARVVDEGGRARFGALIVRSTGFPVKPELARAAEEVLRLYESWDETRFKNLFADAGAKDSLRSSFESARPTLGACRLAPDSATALVGDGGDGATFPVRCEHGDPPDLALEVDARGRIKNIALSPPPPSPFPRRCR